MRFFSAATDAVYEQARLTLDTAWGLPNDKGTATCIAPIWLAPRDAAGRPMVAVSDDWCDWEPTDALLPQLLASGAVIEIGEADYKSNWPAN
jgi:hypothetical protein